jgi:hypothetical protein
MLRLRLRGGRGLTMRSDELELDDSIDFMVAKRSASAPRSVSVFTRRWAPRVGLVRFVVFINGGQAFAGQELSSAAMRRISFS